MLASICGIFFTTVSSVLFKRYKLQGESGKNTFLAWLQAKLLPELPSDTSDALSKLVKNLNKFNNTFAENTSKLGGALKNVNESYRIQADIIQSVHDMDVMKMAKANVNVLKELKDCTDKLEVFNQYLNDIRGYTDAIHKFTTQFEAESDRLHVLEEIQQFFTRHKEEIAKDSADADIALREALRSMKESTNSIVNELNTFLVQQAEEFKQILKDEKDSFENINNEISAKFSSQLSSLPMLVEKLSEISQIPGKINQLIEQVEKSNSMLYSSVTMTMGETKKTIASKIESIKLSSGINSKDDSSANRANWILVLFVFIIAIASITNTAYNIFSKDNEPNNPVEQTLESEIRNSAVDITYTDSMNVDSAVITPPNKLNIH